MFPRTAHRTKPAKTPKAVSCTATVHRGWRRMTTLARVTIARITYTSSQPGPARRYSAANRAAFPAHTSEYRIAHDAPSRPVLEGLEEVFCIWQPEPSS